MDKSEEKQEGQETQKAPETEGMEQRKLSKAEARRLEAFKAQEKELLAQGYVKKDLTTTALKANVVGVLYGVILVAVILGIGVLCGCRLKSNLSGGKGFLIFVLMFALIVVHELIHGITWGLLTKGNFKENIEFGFVVENLTPYCTCNKAMSKGVYLLGALMPCVILGIIPSVVALIMSDLHFFFLGAIMTLSAGGDLLVSQMILTHKTDAKDVLYYDHPTEIGLMVFEKQ